ncbi:MAG TPA: GAF domain-containing sensor histidine kinase [Anaerolineales bacterium]|nr:GAF domain-containing sensor histidine kinase [Anaerolineales bacterium]
MQKDRVKPSEDSRFRILTEISQQITSILDINELLVQVVRLIQRTFNYYHVGIGLVEKAEVVYRVGAGELWDDPNFQFKPQRLKVGSEGITGWVAYTGKPVLAADVSLDPHYVWMQGSLTRSELTVPIIVKGQAIGVLDVQSRHLNDFEQTDLEIMQAIANQAGIAIENARLFAVTQRLLKETEQRANELTIINSVQQELASKLDVQSIYDLVGDTFHNFFNAQVVMISTYDPQSNTVEHRYAIERGARVYSPGTHPPGGFRSQIIRTKQPLLVNTNVAEEAARLGQPILPGTATPRSWLGVPMLLGDQVTGILSVQNVDHENAFDKSDVHLLQTFAASMSIALENARLYEQARQLAILDERQRLARELHDSVTQSLYGISLYAQAATGNINAGQVEQAGQYLEDIQNTAQESLADMRLLIYELRPPILDKEGLIAALQNRLISVEDRVRISSSIQTNLTGRLPSEVEEGLYQITREALNNIIKHARAKNILIRIQKEAESVSMEISDDGIGFFPESARRKGCLGLINMQERAQSQGWQIEIESSPGNGTRIKVETGKP